jgi:hypothetical protein
MPNLASYFNKNILALIPSFSDDEHPRSYTLVGIEPSGLWLESEELQRKLHLSEKQKSSPATKAAFIPFSQISYVLDGTHILTPAQESAARNQQEHRHQIENEGEHQAHRKVESRPKRKK